MAQVQLISSGNVSLPPITYKDQPVITTEMLAEAYGCSAKNIRDNFSNNKERFVEGKHYFILTNSDLKAFRDYTENFGVVVPSRTKHFTLYTEYGSLLHAKSLNTDKAWSVYEMLVETFFRVVNSQPVTTCNQLPPLTITPEQQATLQNMVKVLVEKGGIYANIWSRFNNHFRLGSYKQLPESRMGEAITYLMNLDIAPKVLPAAKPNPLFDFAQAQRINKSLSNKACRLTMDIEKQLDEWVLEASRSFKHSRRTHEIATLEDFVFNEHTQVLKRLSSAVFSNLMAFSVQCSSMAFMAQLLERNAMRH